MSLYARGNGTPWVRANSGAAVAVEETGGLATAAVAWLLDVQ